MVLLLLPSKTIHCKIVSNKCIAKEAVDDVERYELSNLSDRSTSSHLVPDINLQFDIMARRTTEKEGNDSLWKLLRRTTDKRFAYWMEAQELTL